MTVRRVYNNRNKRDTYCKRVVVAVVNRSVLKKSGIRKPHMTYNQRVYSVYERIPFSIETTFLYSARLLESFALIFVRCPLLLLLPVIITIIIRREI